MDSADEVRLRHMLDAARLLSRRVERESPLPALVQWDVLQVHRTRVLRKRPDENVLLVLFHNLQSPSRYPTHGKQGYEQIVRDAEKVVDGTGVEVHVYEYAALSIGSHSLFDAGEDLVPLGLAHLLAQGPRPLPEMPGPGVFGLVHPVTEGPLSARHS